MNTNVISTKYNKLANLLTLLIISSCLLIGCGDNNKNNTTASKKVIKKYAVATTLKGSVINKDGAVKSGRIKVTDASGSIVASTELQDSKHYSVEIPAGITLPVMLTYYPAAGQDQSETMTTAVIYPTMKKFDITPLTTAIAKKAKALGGYTSTNMVLAAKSSVSVPKSNQTVGGFSGDPTKQYGGWH